VVIWLAGVAGVVTGPAGCRWLVFRGAGGRVVGVMPEVRVPVGCGFGMRGSSVECQGQWGCGFPGRVWVPRWGAGSRVVYGVL